MDNTLIFHCASPVLDADGVMILNKKGQVIKKRTTHTLVFEKINEDTLGVGWAQAHPNDKGNINPKAKFLKVDVREYDKLAQIIPEFENIFHMAASVGIAQSNYNIRNFVETNSLGTANILNILANKKHNVKKF